MECHWLEINIAVDKVMCLIGNKPLSNPTGEAGICRMELITSTEYKTRPEGNKISNIKHRCFHFILQCIFDGKAFWALRSLMFNANAALSHRGLETHICNQKFLIICFNATTALNHRMHDDVIKWRHFPRYWPFVRGIHRSPVNSPHKGQWHGALMSTLICARINGWVNNREAGNLRRNRAHYDVIVMARDA